VPPPAKAAPAPVGLAALTAALEREQLRLALKNANGNRTVAARFLGVSRRQMQRLLARYAAIDTEFPMRTGRPAKTG
jgi:transcriptional regulator with GAF, ATPase, and Fis domain